MGARRNIILRVRLSFIEQSVIKSKAKSAGLTRSRFVREAALGNEIKPKHFSEEEKHLFHTLAGIANNINQIAKRYNQGERMHGELLKVLSSTHVIIDKLTGNDR
jgi:hypothetical protein